MAYRLALFSVSKNVRAFLFFDRAWTKSSGSVDRLGESYASFHLPSRFASSTSCKPAGFILPASMSRIAWPTLIFDQILLVRRGVNLRRNESGSYFLTCPSIQP